MAEILLSLTIIGVVAAITLPSLTGNINERTWNTQRKALYARISQAVSLMPALNGYGTLKEESSEGASDAEDTVAETFITAGLSKVLKINNICDSEHLSDCGIVPSLTNLGGVSTPMPTTLYSLHAAFSSVAWSGSSFSTLNTKAAAFETQNGESILAFYNPSCRTDYLNEDSLTSAGNVFGFPESNMCVNFIYDLNGSKGPNTAGKDIGIITIFNATDSITVAPMPSSTVSANNNSTVNWTGASRACTAQDSESRLPNIDELSAMVINKDIFNITPTPHLTYWSSTVLNSERALTASYNGYRFSDHKNTELGARCVKR
ncbi:MAG: hypothetical protein NC390_06165 [Fusobacterium sp.]|nr:hypothetical protein [Fusobacterium sp.]